MRGQDPEATAGSGGPRPQAIPAQPTRQFADLVLAPVEPTQLPVLRELLARVREETIGQMQGQAPASCLVPFHLLEGLHYARFVILDAEQAPAEELQLAFATDYDGPEGDQTCGAKVARAGHVAELLAHAGPGLERIFACCKGFQAGQLSAYLDRHRREASTCYVGAPGRSCRQVLWEAELRRKVERVLNQTDCRQRAPTAVRALVLDALKPDYPEGIPPFPAQPERWRKVERRALVAAGAVVLSLFALATYGLRWCYPIGAGTLTQFALAGGLVLAGALCAAALLVARFRWLERTDPQFQPQHGAAARARHERASTDENHFLQNQLTHLVRVKPGPLRWLLIRAVLAVLQLLATHRYNRGKLGEIPSIHFARWVLGPRRSVLFLSNFDSSWQSYLGDFIDKASSGLSAVWSNTVGYPRTTWLLRAGSRDAARFLAWTRHHQIPSQVWYSAYPGLSIVNINANTEIRRGLAEPDAIDPVDWLARLRNIARDQVDERYGAEQARAAPLRLDDIQGIILKGYGHMAEARYLLFRIDRPAECARLRSWISQLPITSAAWGSRDNDPPDALLNIAFTYEGLQAMGVERTLCDQFSTAFVQGSHHPYRARVNGDGGDDAPARWAWGAGERSVHLVLLVFAKDRARLTTFVEHYVREANDVGLTLLESLEGTTLPDRKEHFGFRDGIGQPVVKGSGDPERPDNSVAAGEFLLGHRDGYENLSHSPVSSEGFAFGFNGSYLVLRQLEQDVAAFWRYCAERAGADGAIRLASKMVGRWPSGASLVRHPQRDPDQARFQDEDAFGYLEAGADNDRYGSRCPFGAHIRRCNPRDWGLGQDSEESLKLANRRRILRRGRPYGPPFEDSMRPEQLCAVAGQDATGAPVSVARGLQFLCFNANIDRQFEFIQQQWCNNPKFAGQSSDPDPLLGLRQPASELGIDAPGFTLQTHVHAGLEQRALELRRFVRVVGSAYFFMPSLQALRLLRSNLYEPDQQPGPRATMALEVVPPDEQLQTDRLTDNLRTMLQRKYAGKLTLRDAHPKMHGCVQGRLEVEPNLPAPYQCGIFARAGSFEVWARFSNQDNRPSSDRRRDTRGVAIKLLNVPGAKLLDGEEFTLSHDFIFLSHPSFVARNVAEFDALIHALVHGRIGRFFLRHPRMALRHWRSLGHHASPLEIDYFSVVPSLLGTCAVKYKLTPSSRVSSARSQSRSDDFLRETMKRQLAEREYSFDLSVQAFKDARRTPIEDPTVTWREADAPFTKLATLRIPIQDFDTEERRAFGERLAFNPWRCLPEHRPLGGINRARRQVYRAIASFRRDRNGVTGGEPS